MQIKGQTPPVTRRAASAVSPQEATPVSEPDIKRARAPWTPARHGWVIAKCGHVTADDLEITAIGAVLRAFKGVRVYCPTCQGFHAVIRKATAAEVVGILPLDIPTNDTPPF